MLTVEPDNAAALFRGAVAAWTAGGAALALERLNRLLSITPQAVAEAHITVRCDRQLAAAAPAIYADQQAVAHWLAAICHCVIR